MAKKKIPSSNVFFISGTQIKKIVQGSKQPDTESFSTQAIDYKGVGPYALNILRKGSFILKSSIKKVSRTSNTKLMSIDDPDLAKKMEKIKSMIIMWGTENLMTSGNAWFEVIRNKKGDNGEVVRLRPFITDTIRLLKGGEGAQQVVGTKTVYYNIFEPDNETKKEKEEIYQKTEADKDSLVPTNFDGVYRTGFNPDLNEAILIKNVNIGDDYYGESEIEDVADMAILLKLIDEYYEKFFLKGAIKTVIIYDKNSKLSPKDRKTIQEEFKKKTSGLDSAFDAMVVNGDLDVIVLDSEVAPDKFVKYREKLRQDILAGMNIPYEMVYSDTSSRNSAPAAKQFLNDFTIIPNQDLFISWLFEISKTLTADNQGDDTLFLPVPDTGNTAEENKSLSELVRSGVITPNEARQESNYDLPDILAGDVLYVPTGKAEQPSDEIPEDLNNIV